MAGAPMLARVGLAFVNFMFAAVAGEPWGTLAVKSVDVIITGASVETRVAGTLIDVGQATSIKVTRRALATESIDHVDAPSSVSARL